MAKCSVCGENARIFAKGKWWCEKHYRLSREKSEKTEESKLDKVKDKLDLGLKRLYKTKEIPKGGPGHSSILKK